MFAKSLDFTVEELIILFFFQPAICNAYYFFVIAKFAWFHFWEHSTFLSVSQNTVFITLLANAKMRHLLADERRRFPAILCTLVSWFKWWNQDLYINKNRKIKLLECLLRKWKRLINMLIRFASECQKTLVAPIMQTPFSSTKSSLRSNACYSRNANRVFDEINWQSSIACNMFTELGRPHWCKSSHINFPR